MLFRAGLLSFAGLESTLIKIYLHVRNMQKLSLAVPVYHSWRARNMIMFRTKTVFALTIVGSAVMHVREVHLEVYN